MSHPLRRFVNFLIYAVLLSGNLYSPWVHASNWFYIETDVTRSSVKVASTEFNPLLPRLKLGFIITPQIMLEAHYAGNGDDTVANTILAVENISAAYLRLDSGIRSDIRMYVLLGSAETRIKTSNASGAVGNTDTYSDFSWGLGLEERVWSKHTLLTLEYSEYYNHDDVIISAVSLGFKFEY